MRRRTVLLAAFLATLLLGGFAAWLLVRDGGSSGEATVDTRPNSDTVQEEWRGPLLRGDVALEDHADPGAGRATPREESPSGATERAPAATRVRAGKVTGRVLQTAERPEDLVVVWTSTANHMNPAGSGAVAPDGTFSLDVPSAWDSYELHVRPRDAFWPDPWDRDSGGLAVGGLARGVDLEVPLFSTFTLRVEGSLDGEGDLPVQMGQFDSRYIPSIRTRLDPRACEVELRGIKPGRRHWVYVGPTSDGRFLYWSGAATSGGRADAALRRGESVWGHVRQPKGTGPRSGTVEVTAYAAVSGLRLVSEADAKGAYEIPGLFVRMNWWVQAEGKTDVGGRLRSDRVQCFPGRREDLVLEEAEQVTTR